MSIIECRISTVELQGEDQLRIVIEAERRFGLEDFQELKQAAFELGQGRRFYNLIEVGALTVPDKETRKVSSSKEGSVYKLADAFVINSLPQKVIGNLMLRLNQPAVPTRFFSNVEEAQAWINKLRAANQNLTVS